MKIKRRNMHMRILIRSLFALWAMAVTVMSVISYPDRKDFVLFYAFTSSGFVLHCCAYFLGMLLCFMAFDRRKKDRDQISDVRSQKADLGDQISDARRQLSKGNFIWIFGLLIFLYSVILEGVQFYLPYRTFNPYDVVANGVGVLGFAVGWILFCRPDEIVKKRAFHGTPINRDPRQKDDG